MIDVVLLSVVSVAYSNGRVNLCDVENASVMHSLTFDSDITYTTWLSGVNSVATSGSERDDGFQDTSSHYLPALPPFTKG